VIVIFVPVLFVHRLYIGGANNLREADVIVMSSGITKLFKFILYDLLIKTSFCSICLTEQCSRVQVSIKKSGFYHLLQYKLNLAATAEKQDATECTNSWLI
jgi:hypothetical protein